MIIVYAFALVGFVYVISVLSKKTFEGLRNLGLKEVKITFEGNEKFINGEFIPLTAKSNSRQKQLISKNPRNKKVSDKK